MITNMSLRELLNEANLSADPITRRLASILEPVVFYHPLTQTAADLEETFEAYIEEDKSRQYSIEDLEADIYKLEEDARALNITINSLRYELEKDLRVAEIAALRNTIMELADKNMVLLQEKHKYKVLYDELSEKYFLLEEQHNTWHAISKNYA